SLHLPQNREGDIYRVFYSVEQLATMLQSKSETEHKTKEFLKDTISDISHQLKTPLSALMMYQEIIENEPDHTETVREFSKKTGTALRRMERLIQSMLKITRLDAGNIVFDQHEYPVAELVERSVSELMTRAHQEKKVLQIQGNPDRTLFCDLEWTSEAVENIVKNALDHTKPGGHITISWEHTPTMVQIQIEDDGNGIPPEDIHHIFKRFYRSSRTISAPGIGLGLPLAKSIVEGQNGQIAVQSTAGMGTVFTLSFLTKL
ncbi:MAG TPA: HAMP domain-containing histidine kinase, partial [Candidatus Choladousia intestinigallinarum]|nr:HAMP domain-containing histidine kinase [Candidatus Choladousia intestinigallinarum]